MWAVRCDRRMERVRLSKGAKPANLGDGPLESLRGAVGWPATDEWWSKGQLFWAGDDRSGDAIRTQLGAGNSGCPIGCQENSGLSDVALRYFLVEVVAGFGPGVRLNGAGAYTIDSDAAAA